jgi:hypothetical protein
MCRRRWIWYDDYTKLTGNEELIDIDVGWSKDDADRNGEVRLSLGKWRQETRASLQTDATGQKLEVIGPLRLDNAEWVSVLSHLSLMFASASGLPTSLACLRVSNVSSHSMRLSVNPWSCEMRLFGWSALFNCTNHVSRVYKDLFGRRCFSTLEGFDTSFHSWH